MQQPQSNIPMNQIYVSLYYYYHAVTVSLSLVTSLSRVNRGSSIDQWELEFAFIWPITGLEIVNLGFPIFKTRLAIEELGSDLIGFLNKNCNPTFIVIILDLNSISNNERPKWANDQIFVHIISMFLASFCLLCLLVYPRNGLPCLTVGQFYN